MQNRIDNNRKIKTKLSSIPRLNPVTQGAALPMKS